MPNAVQKLKRLCAQLFCYIAPQLSQLPLSGSAGYEAVSGSRKFRKEWPGHLPTILTENSIKMLQNFKEKRSRGFLVTPSPTKSAVDY